MKQNFEEALRFVLKWEGGYSDHPSDRGGKTNQGITQAVYDDWRVGRGLSRQPVLGLSRPERDAIYRGRYWDAVRGDDLPAPIDLVLFDAAVNVGPWQAIKWLQRAVGALDDGILGPVTMAEVVAEVKAKGATAIAKSITDQRRAFYARLAEKDARQVAFLKGWNRRCDALELECRA